MASHDVDQILTTWTKMLTLSDIQAATGESPLSVPPLPPPPPPTLHTVHQFPFSNPLLPIQLLIRDLSWLELLLSIAMMAKKCVLLVAAMRTDEEDCHSEIEIKWLTGCS